MNVIESMLGVHPQTRKSGQSLVTSSIIAKGDLRFPLPGTDPAASRGGGEAQRGLDPRPAKMRVQVIPLRGGNIQ